MSTPSTGLRRGLFGATPSASIVTPSSMTNSPVNEGKRIVAARIASSVSGGGAPTRVINAFLQVKDYSGLDRYLGKHKIPTDILTTSLQRACMSSDSDGVDIFSRHGADVSYVDQFGTTLLHFAMRGGGEENVIKALVANGLNYSGWRSNGMRLLHWACSMGFVVLVEHMVEQVNTSLQEPDDHGRLPIHVAAVSGQPAVLSYLIEALSQRLHLVSVPPQFREALEYLQDDSSSENDMNRNEVDGACKVILRNVNGSEIPGKSRTTVRERQAESAQIIAASNYLDMHQWTPLHHASCEEAVNCYQDCLKILLDNGADPMLPTLQGKTALDLAYAAGRSQVLVDVLPKRQLIALLMRIDDIVPPHVRKRQAQKKQTRNMTQTNTDAVLFPEAVTGVLHSPLKAEVITVGDEDARKRTRMGYSFIRRIADNMDTTFDEYKQSQPQEQPTWPGKDTKSDTTNILSVWRKILLNDNVELLETLRDSMVWRFQKHEIPATETDFSALTTPALDMNAANVNKAYNSTNVMVDFETAQKLSVKQMAELFTDCYENGTGVFSYVQTKYLTLLKANDFRAVLRAMTGLLTFNTLSTNKVVILRPMYKSLLFLAIICGRFRVAEQLLRMRQFDVLPAAVLVTLILRRLRKEPSFPQQVVCELERFTDRIESIAVDVLNLVSLKDNTPEKMICRQMLGVPLRTFGDLALLDLFARAKCNELLSLPCCQRLLDERWHGVLITLPNWMRWPTRLIPFTGLIYLEYNRHKAKVNLRNLKQQAQAMRMENSGDQSIVSQPIKKAKTSKIVSKLTSYMTVTSRGSAKEKTADDSASSITPSNTLKDRSMGIYDGVTIRGKPPKSPSWYFISGVYQSPSMKFCLHSLFHLLFLFYFSIVCVYSLHAQFTIPEIISLTYVFGYAVEELRQICLEGLKAGFNEYLKDGWNWIDMLAIILTGIGFCIRLGCPAEYASKYQEAHAPLLYSTRNLYMFGLNLFYMRTLYITSISQIIGPRLKMMADMLRKDLVPLLIVFAIFICSYGVWFQGLIYPNSFYESPSQRNQSQSGDPNSRQGQRLPLSESFKELFKRAFYSIFEVSIVLEEETCENNSYCGSEEGLNTVIYFVLVLYTGIVNIILINLLIALFSNTVSRIDQKATALWLAGRYKMVKEYSERTILPPPFNILCVLYELSRCMYYQCKRCIRRMRHSHGVRDRHPIPMQRVPTIQSDGRCASSESDETVSQPGSSLHESRLVRIRLRNTRYLNEIMGSPNGVKHSDKWELDAVLKFILLQSFSLQDRRQTLGSGMGSIGIMGLQSPSQSNEHGEGSHVQDMLPTMITNVTQQMDRLEAKLDKVLVKLSRKISTENPVKLAQFSPSHLPIPMRMPKVKLNRTYSDMSSASVHIPTSGEMFANLSKQSSLSSRLDSPISPIKDRKRIV